MLVLIHYIFNLPTLGLRNEFHRTGPDSVLKVATVFSDIATLLRNLI